LNISVFINLSKPHAGSVLEALFKAGEKYKISYFLLKDMVQIKKLSRFTVSKKKFINNCKYAIVIGGDGTFISAAHIFADKNVPLLGINIGNFGFLTEVKKEEIEENLANLCNNKIKIEERLILDIQLNRKGKCIKKFKAINEAVITKGGISKVIKLKAFCDDQYIGTFAGDGIMVSTPTGSTGYSLSANGPIIYPVMETFIFNTICPHTLGFRPIIIPSHSIVTVENISEFKDSILTIDGLDDCRLQTGDRIIIKRFKNNLRLITSADRNFFDILREKFNWVE